MSNEGGKNTLVNALIGAAASVVLSFIPFSPLLGGAVAGYLQKGELSEGATVGAISGFLAMVPWVLFLLFVGAIMGLGMFAGPARAMAVGGTLVVLALFFIGVYVVGLSIIGGIIGVYIAEETDIGE